MALKIDVIVETKVAKPMAEVFEKFADPIFSGGCDKDTVKVTLVKGQAYEKGAVYEVDMQVPLFGKMDEMQTVTKIEPNRLFVVESDQKVMHGVETETFEVDEDGKIAVSWEATYDLKWYLFAVAWWMKRTMKAKAQQWIDRTAVAIETGQIPPK